ncbi:hypothetical protein GOP47_0019977 [Adiantum capillus-veneris]|uniref:Pentatricopeptide repeat-containing protein n=1 Tax=Adiantum capillus-veneris TaxID=13818 RepID=A0A9D4UCJ8_ADICA|nr:hypothetical protein GOP47_0019977 [Adiantum capillus-veneris]
MQKEYDVSPSVEHYNCMLDLLGRAGDIEGAQAIVKEMPIHADHVAWRTILCACQRFGYADLGMNAHQYVLPQNEVDANHRNSVNM